MLLFLPCFRIALTNNQSLIAYIYIVLYMKYNRFVTMENLMQAEDAIRQLQNFKLGGNILRVRIAMSEAERLQKKKKQMVKLI